MMRSDEYYLEEVSGAVSLGLLASDVAIAASKLLRDATLDVGDRRALEQCVALLRALAAPIGSRPPAGGLGRLGSKDSALDALQAVQGVSGADVGEYVKPLADDLEASIKSGTVTSQESLEVVRNLFASLSDVEVARVTDLSRPRSESLRWQISRASLVS